MTELVIYAPNIHTGGGAIILNDLLSSLSDLKVKLIVDARYDFQVKCEILYVQSTIFDRMKTEFTLPKICKNAKYILFFGGLPPMRSSGIRSGIFIQNRYLLDGFSFNLKIPKKIWLRLFLERLWLKILLPRVDDFFVQTETMQTLVSKYLGKNSDIVKVNSGKSYLRSLKKQKKSTLINQTPSFFYPASAEPHKNHSKLFLAWVMLAETKPKNQSILFVTLSNSEFEKLHRQVNQLSSIINLGKINHDKILSTYPNVSALIFPSFFESLGLPLIEAQSFGIPIIAAEKDYVRDLVLPTETFDPSSSRSIFRAVERFTVKNLLCLDIWKDRISLEEKMISLTTKNY